MPPAFWTPPTGVALLRMRRTERTVVLEDGTRAKVTVDDSGTATQIETDDRLDAIVRPATTVVRIRKQG